jgi:hypothetical protein
MGVDVYMRWKGFGKQDMTNPNYNKQITGYQDRGKAGYLRISYSYFNYKEATSPFFWNWEKDILFTEKIIKKFIELVKNMKGENEEYKKECLDFAELGRKLNRQDKKPKVHISY